MTDLPLVHQEALEKLLKIIGAGSAVGAAAGGVHGLFNMVTKDMTTPSIGPRPIVVDLKRPKRPTMDKAADLTEYLFNPAAKTPMEIPAFLPAAATLGIGSLGGSYELIRNMLRRKDKRDTNQDLEEAQREYENAIIGQHSEGSALHRLSKAGSAAWSRARAKALEKFAATVTALVTLVAKDQKQAEAMVDAFVDRLNEHLYEKVEKQALLAEAPGLYMTYAALAGIPAGVMGYKYMRSKDPELATAEAIKQRMRERWINRPPELYLRVKDEENGKEKREPIKAD